jgi:hypothetical protein
VSASPESLTPKQQLQLDDSRAFQGLTTAQHRMVLLMFQGLKNAEAYRAVYDTSGMAESTIAFNAARIAAEPAVAAKLREMRTKVEAQSTLAPNLTREFVINGVMGLATNATKESVQLGALLALGKVVGIDLFRETVVHEKRVRTVEDVETELKDRLAELQRQLTTVEGEARRVDAAPAPRDRRRKPKSST